MIPAVFPHRVSSASVIPVGSQFSSVNGALSSTSGPMAVALPRGCAVDDVVVLSCIAQDAGSFQWVAPTGATTILGSTIEAAAMVYAVFAYTLAAANVTAGSVSVSFTIASGYAVSATVTADVYRDVNTATPVDVVGPLSAGTTAAVTSLTQTALGITTTQSNDLLQYVFFVPAPQQNAFTAPVGWITGARPQAAVANGVAWGGTLICTGYSEQANAGATGNVIVTTTFAQAYGGPYGGLLLSLRAFNPTFRLTGTLTGTATVGVAYSSSLSLGGTFTAPVTISAAAGTIPTWMTVSVSGTTVTFSGTPTGAQTDSFTPRATDSSATPQVATGSAESVVVSAASSGPAYVGFAIGANVGVGTITLAIPTGCLAGDVVLLTLGTNDAGTPTPPTGSVNILGGAYRVNYIYSWAFLYTLASADITNKTIALTTTGPYNHAVVATFVHGATTVASFSKAYSATSALTAGSITTTAAALLVYHADAYLYNNGVGISFSTPAAYTLESEKPDGSVNSFSAHATQATAGATGTVSSTDTLTTHTNVLLFALQ